MKFQVLFVTFIVIINIASKNEKMKFDLKLILLYITIGYYVFILTNSSYTAINNIFLGITSISMIVGYLYCIAKTTDKVLKIAYFVSLMLFIAVNLYSIFFRG